MIIRKWNDDVREYEPVEIPDDWKIPMYSDDMDEIINCVNCGREIRFGDGYTSMRYHNRAGFGYYECAVCYEEYYSKRVRRAIEKDEVDE